MYKVGLSTCGKTIDENLFSEYQKNNIEMMEVSPSKFEHPILDYASIKKYADRYGIKLWSYHLPFVPFSDVEPSSPDKSLRKKTLDCFSELIKKVSDIGVDKFVVHPSGEGIEDSERQDRMNFAKDTLNNLAEIASKSNSTICVEDLPRACLGHSSKEVLELISENDKLKVCFDINHLVDEKPEDFIRKLGDKIVTLHVSDYDFIDERHWLPGEGKINWNNVLDALAETHYSGAWLYELGFTSTEDIKRSRDLTCKDFRTNADELFARKEPTVIV